MPVEMVRVGEDNRGASLFTVRNKEEEEDEQQQKKNLRINMQDQNNGPSSTASCFQIGEGI